MDTALLILVAYLLGTIPFCYLVTRRHTGLDLREQGNGNVGLRNAVRVAGLWPGILAGTLDGLKGAAAYGAYLWLGDGDLTLALAGLALVVGHWFPVWLGFRGGVGQAAITGFAAAMAPVPFVPALLAFVIVQHPAIIRRLPFFNADYVIAALLFIGLWRWQGASWLHIGLVVGLLLLAIVKKLVDLPRQREVRAREGNGSVT